jgi:hypothetical protein
MPNLQRFDAYLAGKIADYFELPLRSKVWVATKTATETAAAITVAWSAYEHLNPVIEDVTHSIKERAHEIGRTALSTLRPGQQEVDSNV